MTAHLDYEPPSGFNVVQASSLPRWRSRRETFHSASARALALPAGCPPCFALPQAAPGAAKARLSRVTNASRRVLRSYMEDTNPSDSELGVPADTSAPARSRRKILCWSAGAVLV